MSENWCIAVDNYHKNICTGLCALQQKGEFVDMTIAADGHHVKVHQIVMSLVSPYIKELITAAKCLHPVIFLNRVSHQTMQSIIEFAYTGEVVIEEKKIEEFLDACKVLHIRGLENIISEKLKFLNLDKTIKDAQRAGSYNNIHAPNRKRKKSSLVSKIIDDEEFLQFIEDDDCLQSDDTYCEDDIETRDEKKTMEKVPAGITEDRRLNTKNTPISQNDSEKDFLKLTSTLKYSVSQHGNMQVMHEGYLYSFIHIRKDRQWFWRCVNQQKTGCIAHVTTQGDQVKQRSSTHNHSYHYTQIQKRIRNGNLFTDIREVQDMVFKNKSKRIDVVKQAIQDANDNNDTIHTDSMDTAD